MRLFATTALLALLMPLHHVMGQESSGMGADTELPNAGFEKALFDKVTLSDILKDDKVVGVRFYNVLVPPDNLVGSAMAVGIHTDGSEANTGKAYRLSLGLVGGKVVMSNLNAKNAASACGSMRSSGHPSYSAAFTRTDVEALLDLDGCQALQATPDVTDKDETTMRLTAMKITGGKADPLGADPAFMRVCGFPCPSVCGPKQNYVYRFP